MRIIGLDVGEKRVGVAVSDPLGKTAQPLMTMERDQDTPMKLADLVSELGAERVVVGLPKLMNGTEGAQASLVRSFVAELMDRVETPIAFVDERLSTREADTILFKAGESPGLRKGAADRIAAALVLRSYLDSLIEE